ncbi:T9SS type A sorting domain-containing protein [Flavobacterium cellulosilyticum]|uniref:T9SS type A sorting domain-containing protein n=1 Tax=Flavobacterium cellulosilyticum TaxID=2541731 RepID=A0A4R5CLE3_9FLAO|nr:T9SS type A sorting domain-containing protein [Flavobacterium cellulosilyticum]TDD99450.1 T9SS type A sorting domain-containing protein [Flavobacterium cellulosilyticum]
MNKKLFSKNLLSLFTVFFLIIATNIHAQNYNWVGTTSDFYTASNWTSTSGSVVFDNSSFKFVRTNATGNSAVINQFIAWQPGVFDNTSGLLTINANFNVFYNDVLNGIVTVNTGAIFTCRNIFRVGSGGSGTVNVNGGTFRSSNVDTWQGVFIGANKGGNGTANINTGGVIDGGYQLEIGTRDFYPTGLLNVNTGGIAGAYWATLIGPNGTINVNGGTLNTGETFKVGDLFLDNAGNAGTIGSIVGKLNINSGTVNVNQNDSGGINFSLHANSKVVIDAGSLVIKRTGVDYTSAINTYVTNGQIAPIAGKSISVTYNGVLTTVTATSLGVANFNKELENSFVIYPNPVKNDIHIMSKVNFGKDLKVSVVNLIGETIIESQTIKADSDSYTISTKNKLSAGIYLVQINTENGIVSKKIIVK